MTIETEAPVERSRWRPPKADTRPDDRVTTPTPPSVPGRRNPKWIALGVVALCLGALLSYVIYARVADEAAVVVVVNTVHRGDTIRAADLSTVNLRSTTGVQMVPGAQLRGLVGQKAVYDLVGGSLLPVGAVAKVAVPQTGRAIVGIRLISGRAPSGFLPPGSPLRLVVLPPAGADPAFSDQYTGRTIIVREISQTDGADGTSIVINVDVPANQASVVALLASQERLAAVRDADR